MSEFKFVNKTGHSVALRDSLLNNLESGADNFSRKITSLVVEGKKDVLAVSTLSVFD